MLNNFVVYLDNLS